MLYIVDSFCTTNFNGFGVVFALMISIQRFHVDAVTAYHTKPAGLKLYQQRR